ALCPAGRSTRSVGRSATPNDPRGALFPRHARRIQPDPVRNPRAGTTPHTTKGRTGGPRKENVVSDVRGTHRRQLELLRLERLDLLPHVPAQVVGAGRPHVFAGAPVGRPRLFIDTDDALGCSTGCHDTSVTREEPKEIHPRSSERHGCMVTRDTLE